VIYKGYESATLEEIKNEYMKSCTGNLDTARQNLEIMVPSRRMSQFDIL
jgi:hypothetical protein